MKIPEPLEYADVEPVWVDIVHFDYDYFLGFIPRVVVTDEYKSWFKDNCKYLKQFNRYLKRGQIHHGVLRTLAYYQSESFFNLGMISCHRMVGVGTKVIDLLATFGDPSGMNVNSFRIYKES